MEFGIFIFKYIFIVYVAAMFLILYLQIVGVSLGKKEQVVGIFLAFPFVVLYITISEWINAIYFLCKKEHLLKPVEDYDDEDE